MPGSSPTTLQTSATQVAQSQPWAPSQANLIGILNQSGVLGGGNTTNQTGALNSLYNATTGLPNYGPSSNDLVNRLFGGAGAQQYAPMAQDAYTQYQQQLSPYTTAQYINPLSNPFLGTALNTLNSDITNQINSSAAAAGGGAINSPANARALARGLSEGEGGLLTGQYNTNVGNALNASNNLYQAGNTSTGLLTGLNQTEIANMLSGLQAAGPASSMYLAPYQAQVGAANAQAQQPYQNLGWLSSLVNPIAALGGQSNQTGGSTGTTTQPQWTPGNILGGVGTGLGALGATGAFGTGGWGAAALAPLLALSDRKVKDDVEPIGMLFDKTPVYSFRYKGDPTPRVGLMAQDVERTRPDAVAEVGGVKMVDYGKATERSRAIGGLLTEMAA